MSLALPDLPDQLGCDRGVERVLRPIRPIASAANARVRVMMFLVPWRRDWRAPRECRS